MKKYVLGNYKFSMNNESPKVVFNKARLRKKILKKPTALNKCLFHH